MLLCDMFSRKSRGFFYVWLCGQSQAQVFMPSKTYEFACAGVHVQSCMHVLSRPRVCVHACSFTPRFCMHACSLAPLGLYACIFCHTLGSACMYVLSRPWVCMHACSLAPSGLCACMFFHPSVLHARRFARLVNSFPLSVAVR